MVKSTKPKTATIKTEEVKPVEETVKTGSLSANPNDDEMKVVDMPKSEAIEKVLYKEPVSGDTPPSVTLNEVEQVKEEPIVEKSIISEADPLYTAEEVKKIIDKWEPSTELSNEQKILNYLEGKSGEVGLNDFLKSLFPLPKSGEPPVWLQQGSSRTLRSVLEGLQSKMLINIINNRHRLLGQSYYPDATTGKQQHHNLNTVIVVAKK